MGCIIREIEKKDIPDIKTILETSNSFSSEEIQCAIEMIYTTLASQDDYRFLCCEKNNRVVGYTCYGPIPLTQGTFDLYWICVNQEFQKHGVGKRLLHETENKIINSNGRLVVVETSSDEKYRSAIKFYKKNNFSVASVIKDFYRDGEDKIIFIKNVKV